MNFDQENTVLCTKKLSKLTLCADNRLAMMNPVTWRFCNHLSLIIAADGRYVEQYSN